MTAIPKTIPLVELLDRARLENFDVQGNPATPLAGLSLNAQRTERHQMYVAIAGTKTDGHLLISEAVQRGASAVLVEREVPPYPGVAIVRVESTRRALGPLAHAFHDNPTRDMRVVAVTGTNGKTSTSRLAMSVLASTGATAGTIGTLGAEWKTRRHLLDTTTPDALTLARLIRQMRDDGVEFLTMEASSHAIDQHRIGGLPVHVGVLTNVSQDHLDYHGDFPSYIAVKRRLFFDWVARTPGGIACFNEADPVGEELCFSFDKSFLRYTEYETEKTDVTARNVRVGPDGIAFDLLVEGRAARVASRLTGRFMVSNMLGAAAACHALGVPVDAIARGLSLAPPIPGRFERVDEGQPFNVIVDYAHTPDALEKLLRSVRQITAGRVVTVAGCGGDRDRTKRYPMGAAAAMGSDVVIVTSDNPRGEDPAQIARDMLAGVTESGIRLAQVQSVLDRAQAIERALLLAGPGDCVVIAGKGHEPYQEVAGVRYAFDDREVTRGVLRAQAGNWKSTTAGVDVLPASRGANDATVGA